ncbi:MAG: hypothetical protein RMJ82_08535 [Gemmatales bacterium]|nr:hypothetical protein [Gemmatales bacterium]
MPQEKTAWPARSITRFLLPMADVMALLFSLFLLLPHLGTLPGASHVPRPGRGLWTPEEQQRVWEELTQLRRSSEALPGFRDYLVPLKIDGDTGRLYLQTEGRDIEITDQNVRAVIDDFRQRAARAGQKRLTFLLIADYSKPHPDQRDEARFRRWFAGCRYEYIPPPRY